MKYLDRSKGLSQAFYADFAHVADDEARHLGWCLQRLAELDARYLSTFSLDFGGAIRHPSTVTVKVL